MHSNVICANFRALMPAVSAHGYSAESIAAVVDSCLAEVSSTFMALVRKLISSCAIPSPSICSASLQCTGANYDRPTVSGWR